MADKKKNSSRSQVSELNASEKLPSAKSVKSPMQEERRASAKRGSKPMESKSIRRDTRGAAAPSAFTRIRNSKAGRFLIEAYYELRHKVTWPTFIEARNMTIAVIVISIVIGGVLSLLDLGLLRLFLIISGGH